MARRGENIRYRKDGRWEARYFVTDPVTGKRKCRSPYAKTYAEAKQKRLDALSIQRANLSENVTSPAVSSPADSEGGTDGCDHPLADTAQAWLGEVSESKKPSTYSKYKRIYESFLMPQISQLSASDIAGRQEIDLRDVVELSGKKLSDSVRKSIYGVMNHILEHYNAQYHANIRLAKSIKKNSRKKPVESLTKTEQDLLFTELGRETDRNKFGILLCLTTGLRLGEVCALKWSDIDLENKLLCVNRTVQRLPVEGQQTRTMLMEGPPKSSFSERVIPLPDRMIPYLTAFQREEGYVISDSKAADPRTFQYQFQKVLSSAGIKKHNAHILRHTFATNCMNRGFDAKSLSELLEHSNVNITLNRYVHPSMEIKRALLNNLSDSFESIRGQNVGQTA